MRINPCGSAKTFLRSRNMLV